MNKILAYYLALDLPEHNFLRIDGTLFELTAFGGLRFMDRVGIQYVKADEWNNLKVFELGSHTWLIVQEGKFTQSEIKAALVACHRKRIEKKIEHLNKVLEKL